MRSNRAITLTSLIIYIIGVIIFVAILSNMVGYFNKNINTIVIDENSKEQYSNFLSYISKDTNSEDLVIVKSSDENSEDDYVIFKFEDGTEHQYICANDNIYYINIEENNNKKILLCEDVLVELDKAFDYYDGSLYIDFDIGKENFSTTLNVNI